MRTFSYLAISLLFTALGAQAADTMGTTPSPTGTNTTPMQSPPASAPGAAGLNSPSTTTNNSIDTPAAGTNSGTSSTGVNANGRTSTGVEMQGAAPDNTAINQRDRNGTTLTPANQSNSRADVSTTSAVRQALVKSNLSTTARNIKIITANGRVTLRGPVKTEEEKARIEAVARSAAGSNAVDNQLDVKATTY